MQGANAPRIGLVSDNDLHRHTLQTLLTEQGYQLSVLLNTESLSRYFDTKTDIELDAWLVDMVGADDHDSVEVLVEGSDLPMLVIDDMPPAHQKEDHDIWRRRLLEKLEIVALPIETNPSVKGNQPSEQSQALVAETVWVLAASLGGPDAVKSFLNALPEGLALAMVYVQHIEVNFDGVLASAVSGKHAYPLHVVRNERQLLEGQVAVVPADRQLRFLPHGQVVATRKPWTGLYQPAINQVISDLSRVYRQRLGVIIFSGLCSDGEIGCRVAKANGATVWAQAPQSCQSPEMVEAAIATGCVSFQGSPEQLAQALAKKLNGTGP
jgi:chemosensory pili system protein ChpB (putative protein-glutamate methylesterase)